MNENEVEQDVPAENEGGHGTFDPADQTKPMSEEEVNSLIKQLEDEADEDASLKYGIGNIDALKEGE